MLFFKETEIPLYNHFITFVATDSWKKFEKKFDYNPDRDDDLVYATTLNGFKKVGKDKDQFKCIYVVFNPTYRTAIINGVSIGTIAHEAVHAKNYLYYARGLQSCPCNDEPEAYLVDWITQQAYEFLETVKEKIK